MHKWKKRWKKLGDIARFLKGNTHFLVLALLAGMLNTAFNALTPQIIRYTVDHLTGQTATEGWGRDGRFLAVAAAAVVASAVAAGIFTYVSSICLAKGSEGFLKSMRDQLYRHIQKLPYTWHVAHKTGDIIQRCTNDVEIIRNFVCNQLMDVIRIVFLMVLYHRLFRVFLFQDFQKISGRGRGGGGADGQSTGKSHRRAGGPGFRAGILRDRPFRREK